MEEKKRVQWGVECNIILDTLTYAQVAVVTFRLVHCVEHVVVAAAYRPVRIPAPSLFAILPKPHMPAGLLDWAPLALEPGAPRASL
jgi:hypothetical protein